jgi:hypothetical protein
VGLLTALCVRATLDLMILGEVAQFSRFPFSRPAAASTAFRPSLLQTSYRSQNFHPMPSILPTMSTYAARLPGYPVDMGPGPAPVATPVAPTPAPMGAAAMMRGQRLNPTLQMRTGTFPNINGNASNVRYRVTHAEQLIRQLGPRG